LEVFLESAKNQIIDYSEDNNSEILDLERELIDILAKMKESERKTLAQKMVKNIESFIRDIHSKGFIDISLDKITTAEIIIISKPNEEYYIKKDFLTDQSTFLDRLENDLYKGLEPLELAIYRNIISNISNPNLIFSKELTNHQKQLNIASVPKTIEIIPEGTTIVKKGELIDEKTQNRINSYFESELIQKENNYPFLYILSNFGYVFILYSILLLYLFVLRKKIFYDNKQMAIISFILILSALLSWLSMEIKIGYSVEYLVFIPALSMLVAVVYDSRTAFYVTVTMSLMLAGIRGNDYDLAITMLFSGTLAAYTVKDIQNRTQMFQSMFYIFIGLMLSIIVFSIENNLNWNVLYQKTAFALINAALSPLLALGLIILLEKASSITTDLKIKEFDNLDHPLLVKLSETAPGTYQHSLGVASLAERCARRVNGNPLLVKVGSYLSRYRQDDETRIFHRKPD
jgi:membrane-associated HD superfamily phosphohydrolase